MIGLIKFFEFVVWLDFGIQAHFTRVVFVRFYGHNVAATEKGTVGRHAANMLDKDARGVEIGVVGVGDIGEPFWLNHSSVGGGACFGDAKLFHGCPCSLIGWGDS